MQTINQITRVGTQKFLTLILVSLFATTILVACGGPPSSNQYGDIHKIKHVVVIMQENRSFDTYFGTYPGADGIPSGVCVPNPRTNQCVKPYHNTTVALV
jgi:phospholipase C